MVFFHEVTVKAGVTEGTHQHIGSEELYYITEGTGTAYVGEHDDPALEDFPVVEEPRLGLGVRRCRQVPVKKGSVIYTKWWYLASATWELQIKVRRLSLSKQLSKLPTIFKLYVVDRTNKTLYQSLQVPHLNMTPTIHSCG